MYQISLEDDMGGVGDDEGLGNVPSSSIYGIHTEGGWGSKLPINFRFSYEISPELRESIRRAMGTWEMASGRQLFRHIVFDDDRSGDSFEDLYTSLHDGDNGYYIDRNWIKTGKSEEVIATTIWDNMLEGGGLPVITTADIRFNFQHYKIGDSFALIQDDARSVVDMESLALHELGHLLGLAHIAANVDPYSIMNPSLLIGEGLANRKISKGDIERLQQIYGCYGMACDVEEIFLAMERGMEIEPYQGSGDPEPQSGYFAHGSANSSRKTSDEEKSPSSHQSSGQLPNGYGGR